MRWPWPASRPVFLAGGIATGADTRAALAAGASGVIAGTRFLMTHEANANGEYQRRIMHTDITIETNLFGLMSGRSGIASSPTPPPGAGAAMTAGLRHYPAPINSDESPTFRRWATSTPAP